MIARFIKDTLGVTIGVIQTAIGLDAFLLPAKISVGGLSGVATIFYYLLIYRWSDDDTNDAP